MPQAAAACLSKLCAFGRFTDDAQAQRDRARRTQDNVRPFGAKLGNILEQALEEAIARREEFKVGKEVNRF